ncbi:MAG: arsenate reductase ArsC [bacterium]
MLKVMFLCTGNSCRSQMAEGFARALGQGVIEPYSAGVMPSDVHPKTVQVMKEVGIDISNQRSKGIEESLLNTMDIVITLCSSAEAMCPVTPPRIRRMHWSIDDPKSATGTEEEVLNAFRNARDEIRKHVAKLIEDIRNNPRKIKNNRKDTMPLFKIKRGSDDGNDM